MKIALIGATGFVGSAILQEALNRGHKITAIGNVLRSGIDHQGRTQP